jgi:hypothetical protein
MASANRGLHKDLRPLVKQLKKRGITVAPTKNGHYGVYAQDGTLVQVIAGSTSDRRSMANLKADLRRKGMID